MTFAEATQITTPVQWCVVITSLSCNPIVQGPFATREAATAAEQKAIAHYTSRMTQAEWESDDWTISAEVMIPVTR